MWGGRAQMRMALYMGAIVETRFNPVIGNFYQRLCAAGKTNKEMRSGLAIQHPQQPPHPPAPFPGACRFGDFLASAEDRDACQNPTK